MILILSTLIVQNAILYVLILNVTRKAMGNKFGGKCKKATADQMSLPKFKLATAQNSFSFKGAKLWNYLPISIESSTSLSSFKRNLLKHLRNPVK